MLEAAPGPVEVTTIADGPPPEATEGLSEPGSGGSWAGLESHIDARYDALEQLGAGGMGTVLRGRDLNLRRTVALKVISPEHAHRADLLARFRAEAQIIAQLEHPSIVPIYACEQTREGHPAFSMKLIRGRTFTDYIDDCITRCARDDDPDPEHRLTTRLERFVKICDAIAFAHARGVVHRDLKPENVMIGDFEAVYVMDWGLARLVADTDTDTDASGEDTSAEPPTDREPGDASPGGSEMVTDQGAPDPAGTPGSPEVTDGSHTRVGEAIGTLTHMPPEQARGDRHRMGPSVDLYALGMILFELVTLEEPRPFRGDLDDLRRRARAGEVAPIKHRHGHPITPGLAAIIRTATAPDPARRYASVEALGHDVRAFLRGDAVSVLPDPPLRRLGRVMERYPAAVLLVLLSLVIVGAGVWVAGLRSRLALEAAQLDQTRALAELVGKVSLHAERLDGRAQSVKILLEGLAAETLAALERPGASGTLFPEAAAFEAADPARRPSSAVYSERYGQYVSWKHPNWITAPGADPFEVERQLERLGPLEGRLRGMMVRSVDAPEFKDAAHHEILAPEAQIALLAQEDAFLQYTYVGLESGLLINYPGLGNFGAGYDPRKRPWYRSNVGQHGARWGSPYPDAAGSAIMVPCNRAIYDRSGHFIGVAGAGMRLDDVVAALAHLGDPETGIEGFVDATLVDGEGVVIVSSHTDAEAGVDAGINDNQTLPRVPFDDPEILALLTERDGTRQRIDDRRITVVSHLPSIDWSLVVRVERGSYF